MQNANQPDGQARVLLLGLRPRNLELAANVLREAGCEVFCVETDEDLRRALEGPIRYGVAVIDTDDGNQGFADVLSALREAGVPFVVLLPGGAAPASELEWLTQGARSCFVKPVTPELLVEIVRLAAGTSPCSLNAT